MIEIFKQIFFGMGLSEEQITKFAGEFSGILIAHLIETSSDLLNEGDKNQLAVYLENKELDKGLEYLQSKYSTEEWKFMLKKEAIPVFDSYLREVIYP